VHGSIIESKLSINLNFIVMKRASLFSMFILFFILGCQDKQMKSEFADLKTKAQTEQQNKIVVEKYFAGWNSKDLKVLDEIADPQFGMYNPSISQKPMNSEQTKAWAESIFKSFPDVKYDIKEILADGDKVIIWWTFTGTHQGDIWNLPATGKKVTNSAIEIYKLKDGKILEERTEIDGMSFYQQLGMEMQPKK
jgi:steroid delta-isomerase-like uncharacterized protein